MIKIDLGRVAQYIGNNGLWERPLSSFSQAEIERLCKAVVHIAGTWPPDLAVMINWLRDYDMPQEFQHTKTTKIVDGPAFKEKLLDEVAQGPGGPRAFYGALQSDIRRLYRKFGPPENQDELPF